MKLVVANSRCSEPCGKPPNISVLNEDTDFETTVSLSHGEACQKQKRCHGEHIDVFTYLLAPVG